MTSPELLRDQAARCREVAKRYPDTHRAAFEVLADQLEAQALAMGTSAAPPDADDSVDGQSL